MRSTDRYKRIPRVALALAMSVSFHAVLLAPALAEEKVFDWEILNAIPRTEPAEPTLPLPPVIEKQVPATVVQEQPAAPPAVQLSEPAATPAPVQTAEPPVASNPVAEARPAPVDPFATALSERLKTDSLKTLFAEQKDREALEAFYAARNYASVWTDEKGMSARAEEATMRLKASADDGLDPAAFLVSGTTFDTAEKRAEAELRIARSILAYARQAAGGRTVPRRISNLITIDPPRLETAMVLGAVASGNVTAALASFNPVHPGFQRLRSKLVDIRRNAAIATPAERRLESDIIANMERWRWLPRDLGENHVLVNIPDYEVSIYSKGQRIHKTRVVVGKPVNQTPVFSNEFQFVVVNPSWYVPISIQRKEMSSDPSVLAKKGFQVVYGRERVVDANGRTRYVQVRSVRQPPGERNALGRVKFMFPNQHSVYLHDTPSRHLFAQEKRAFSHGCVRVHQPELFGEKLMQLGLPGENWTAERLTSLYGKSERRIDLKQRIPVHIAYFTLTIDETGAITQRDDIYGHHAKVRAALGSEEKVATIR